MLSPCANFHTETRNSQVSPGVVPRRTFTQSYWLSTRFTAPPASGTSCNVPEGLCPGCALKRTNWVLYPPASAKCGKYSPEAGGGTPSFPGGVDVIRRSFLSLY